MKIIAGSVQQVAESFLHAGYLSASSVVLGRGGVTGSIAELTDLLASNPVVLGLLGLIVVSVVAGAAVVLRRLERDRRRLWIAVLASLVTVVTMGAVVTSFFFVLGSAPRDAALH